MDCGEAGDGSDVRTGRKSFYAFWGGGGVFGEGVFGEGVFGGGCLGEGGIWRWGGEKKKKGEKGEKVKERGWVKMGKGEIIGGKEVG